MSTVRMSTAIPQRDVVLLGSTGSIGTQAIELMSRNTDRFRVRGIAGGSNAGLLAQQAVALRVETVALADEAVADELTDALRVLAPGYRPEVLVGADAAEQLAGRPARDARPTIVLNGITGSIGLRATLAVLAAGHTLALANKESLITGGPLVKAAAAPGQIVPVDSEHSALAQALRGGRGDEVEALVITASGGPFRGRSRAQLGDVTPAQALNHPTWSMGPVITINSATLVNKGLEVIEAQLLFDVPMERIEVVVHPQSIIHSMVRFVDGSTLAQASPPDMRLPIGLALAWPDRLPGAAAGCDWSTASSWTFEPLDDEAFPAVAMARSAGAAGGTAPAVYNAANEECVEAFRRGRLPFLGIVDTIGQVLAEHGSADAVPLTIDDVLAADAWARARAAELINAGG